MRGRFGWVVLLVVAGSLLAIPSAPAQVVPCPAPIPAPFVCEAPTATPTPSATPTSTPAPIATVPVPTPTPSPTPTPEPAGDRLGPVVAVHTRGLVRRGRRVALTVACSERCVVRLRVVADDRSGERTRVRVPVGDPVPMRLQVPRGARESLRVLGRATDGAGNVTRLNRAVRS